MNRKLAALVLVAALAGCGTPGTVTTELVAPASTPRGWTTEVPPAFDADEPVTQGTVVPLQVPTVDVAQDVSPHVEPVRKAVAPVATPLARKATTQRKATVEPVTAQRKAVQPAPVAAPVVQPAPVVTRAARPVATPPAVVSGQGSAGESVPGVPSVVISPAPHIDRGVRQTKPTPVVVTPAPEPAADALATDDVPDVQPDVVLLEKER